MREYPDALFFQKSLDFCIYFSKICYLYPHALRKHLLHPFGIIAFGQSVVQTNDDTFRISGADKPAYSLLQPDHRPREELFIERLLAFVLVKGLEG